jgi:hypothetical protein
MDAGGTVTNSATIRSTSGSGDGVNFGAGGSVANTGAGLIAGANGVVIFNAAGTVSNSGSILGTGTTGYGVRLYAGGSVDNTDTGLIEGYSGIGISGSAGTVTNSGAILGTGTYGYGVGLNAGGSVDNSGTGLIEGASGVYIEGDVGTVTNSATIHGTAGSGVALNLGGSVDNTGTGRIEGYSGVRISSGAGTVTNFGTLLGTGTSGLGARLNAGGSVDNSGAGLIEGASGVRIAGTAGTVTNAGTIVGTSNAGVYLASGGTIVDSGAIIGGAGTAISLGGVGSNLVVLQAGFQLTGGIAGGLLATDTVELAGTVGAAVTADYNGLTLTSFENVLFGGGGYSTLLVSSTTGTLGVTISGFDAATEIIDLTGIGDNGTITNRDTDTDRITVTGSLGSLTLQFDSIDAINFSTSSDGSGGTDLIPVCYCRGTQILTDLGEVAVEDLAIGDRVMTISGEVKPVKWVGYRAYDGRFVAGNRAMLPVRIAAGALADGVPVRDLCVSPGHALLVAGMLVRAEHLLNGATITQEEAVERIEYFHVELEAHEIIIADGAPAESYIDCDNRGKFHNAGEFARLYPDDDQPRWQYCRPLLDWDSPEPDAIREALLARAERLGHQVDRDPDLHLVVDGAVIRPETVEGRVYRFAIPSGSAAALLASRSVVPAEVEPSTRDRRPLGVPVEHIVLDDGALRIEADHDHMSLADGFYDDEATHRWTGGLARLPESWLRVFPGAFTLEVHLRASDLPYRLPLAAAERREAA